MKTIKCWFQNSDNRGDPGIQDDHIERLRKLADDHKEKNGREMICSLVFDEMNIRQQTCYSLEQHDYVGHVTDFIDEEELESTGNKEKPVAKQALVFILKGIDVNFEFPISYYFINTLKHAQRSKLLTEIIKTVSRCGITISNITFDGYSSNLVACNTLGANLDVLDKDFKPYFLNPLNEQRIYIFLDPCHMEKLVRGRLASTKFFVDGNEGKIEWKYIEKLHDYTVSHGLQTHKLTKKHIQWKSQSMSVRLAVETFSESVASSIEKLMQLNIPEFNGAQPTVDFNRRMNRLFDIFNTTNSNHKDIFKRSLSAENKRIIFAFLKDTIQFFKTLKVEVTYYVKQKGKKQAIKKTKLVPILKSRHKCSFRGFIIDMESLMMMFTEYVEEKKLLLCIPTYNLLQDVIEMLFARIRSCGGFNNNPNVLQFKGSYRKILCNMKLDLSKHSNCRFFDSNLPDNLFYSNIYFVSSRRAKTVMDPILYEQQKDDILDDLNEINQSDAAVDTDEFEEVDSLEALNQNHHVLDGTANFMVEYIASLIEKKIMECNSFHCDNCRYVFYENESVASLDSHPSKKPPCVSTVKICKIAERFFKLYDERKKGYNFQVLYCLIFRTMNFEQLYAQSEFECSDTHKYQFIKCIVGLYLSIRGNYNSKQITLARYDKIIRHKYNRLVINSGQ